MPWWGWLLVIVATAGGATLLTVGAEMERRHVEAELGLSRKRQRRNLKMLGSALRRDTPAFTGHVSMCIGCGQTDGTHVDRIGVPCPYSFITSAARYTTSAEYVANTTEEEREAFTRALLNQRGITIEGDER